ncbi:capsular polysaccharide biosynthesis protein, partial [Escherichia coli]|nr:capsular polysaccharide biosynthesis protein [Escherichia coli]
SVGMRKIRNLQQFLSQNEQCLYHCSELYLGWGRKKSFFDALKAAQRNHKNCICLEDGFIRSMGLGKQGYTPLSLVVDRTGIYFD